MHHSSFAGSRTGNTDTMEDNLHMHLQHAHFQCTCRIKQVEEAGGSAEISGDIEEKEVPVGVPTPAALLHAIGVFDRGNATMGNTGIRAATHKCSGSQAGATILRDSNLGATADVHDNCVTSIPPPLWHPSKMTIWWDGTGK